jgi:S1-C subfamily serine protease
MITAPSRTLFLFLAVSPFLPADAFADGKLDDATLRSLKDATVYVQVELPNGRVSQGSGFFALEPGLIFTNAHVVGMLEPDSRRPKKIEVTIRRGEAKSRTLDAELLGVDGDTDLAVLRVVGKDLPKPLKLASTKALAETQDVFIFGFPFGKQLGKEITVSKTSISSLRKDKGAIVKVQTNGGMHPGNSGGPVTDAEGKVIGVAVSGLADSQIHFAIPADSVQTFLNGRLKGFRATLIYRDGDKLKQPIQFALVDPLGRVRKVSVEYWLDEAKPAKDSKPKKSVLVLDYDKKGLARGEIIIPAPENPKHVLWFAPVMVDAAGVTRRYGARPIPILPLERKAAELVYRPKPGVTRKLALDSQTRLTLLKKAGTLHSLGLNLSAQLTLGPDPKVKPASITRLQMGYDSLKIKLLMDGQAVNAPELRQAEKDAKQAAASLELNKDGSLEKASMITKTVPEESRAILAKATEQLLDTTDALVVPLPGKKVEPLEKWKAKRVVWIGPPGASVPAEADLQYTYLGRRVRAGKPEATIEITGKVSKHPKAKSDVVGTVSGTAVVDLGTGVVVSADLSFVGDLEIMVEGKPAQASGTLSIQLKR